MIPNWEAGTLSHINQNFAKYSFGTEARNWHAALTEKYFANNFNLITFFATISSAKNNLT